MVWKPLRVRADDIDPRPVGASLPDVARRFGLAAPNVLGAIFTDWDELVGVSIARHARPVGLRGGLLMIDVDEPGWVTELQFLREDLLARLAEAAGEGAVTELSVRVRRGLGGRVRPNSPEFGQESVERASDRTPTATWRGRKPRDSH
jgi:predicted nucleic acid-binding Zn ribbon protein